MNFGFDKEHDELRATVRQFIKNEFPRDAVRARLEDVDTFDRAIWSKAAGLGWAGLLVAEDLGGGAVTEQPLVDLYVLVEELGRQLQPWPVMGTSIVAAALATFGTDAQKKELLGPVLAGDLVAAWCFDTAAVPGGGVDVAPVEITRDGSGYELSGTVPYALDAGGADLLLVDGAVDGESVRLVLPADTDGVTIVPRQSFDLTRRLGEVTFDRARVGLDAALDGAPVSRADLERDVRIAVALIVADCVGGQEAITEESVGYAKLRETFGRTIGSFQAMKHKLADMQCSLEASRGAAYYIALAVEEGFDDAEFAASAAKSYVADQYVRMAHDNIQVHGGTGFTWEHDAHLFMRRAMTNQLIFGTSRDHRERVFALAADEDEL